MAWYLVKHRDIFTFTFTAESEGTMIVNGGLGRMWKEAD
jgi:hypothetical protein